MKTTLLIVGFYKDNAVVLIASLLVIEASLVDILLGRSNIFFPRTRPNFRLGNTVCTVEWKLCISPLSQTCTLHLHSSVNECFGARYRTLSRVEDICLHFKILSYKNTKKICSYSSSFRQIMLRLRVVFILHMYVKIKSKR